MDESILQKKSEYTTSQEPSLLRQIVDEVDAMDSIQQQILLFQLRKDKILADAKELDEKLKGNTIHLTEEEIAEIVSKDRRERYEQAIRP